MTPASAGCPKPAIKDREAPQELDRQVRGCRVTLVELLLVLICFVLFSLCSKPEHGKPEPPNPGRTRPLTNAEPLLVLLGLVLPFPDAGHCLQINS